MSHPILVLVFLQKLILHVPSRLENWNQTWCLCIFFIIVRASLETESTLKDMRIPQSNQMFSLIPRRKCGKNCRWISRLRPLWWLSGEVAPSLSMGNMSPAAHSREHPSSSFQKWGLYLANTSTGILKIRKLKLLLQDVFSFAWRVLLNFDMKEGNCDGAA